MRRGIGSVLAIVLAACSTTPTLLVDLEEKEYTDTQMVINQLDCKSVITEFHIGQGVTTEPEAVRVGREADGGSMAHVIQRAEKAGDHIWVLTTEAGQVIGAMSSQGGVSLCVQDVADGQP